MRSNISAGMWVETCWCCCPCCCCWRSVRKDSDGGGHEHVRANATWFETMVSARQSLAEQGASESCENPSPVPLCVVDKPLSG